MVRKLLFFLLIFSPLVGFAQGLDADNYETEFIWGINKNTSGGLIGGVIFRTSKRVSDRMYQSIGFELMNVKHPLEVRTTSVIGNQFIFGKSNYLYAIRAQYGRELVLFRKASQQGVEIKAVMAVGPSIGLLAPYYIDYTNDPNSLSTIRSAPYRNQRFENILGTGRLFQGIQESKLKIGGNFKAALSFELGTLKSHVTGIETGFLIDAYTSKIDLMPAVENDAVFPTAFITLFYGRRR